MRSFLNLLLLVFISSCGTAVIQNNATIHFDEMKHDFGVIPYKNEATYSFEFSNSGKAILIINDVKTSCGCTVPEWPKEPIRPGGKGIIKIKYDAAFPGVFHKTAEVYYNGSGSPDSLEIKGEVEYPEEHK